MTQKNRREKKPREAKVTFEGLVTEALPNGMFLVRLENDTIILGYILGKTMSFRGNILKVTVGLAKNQQRDTT